MLPLRNTEMQFAYPWFAVDFCSIWPFNGTWPLFWWSSRFITPIHDSDRAYIMHQVDLARYPPGTTLGRGCSSFQPPLKGMCWFFSSHQKCAIRVSTSTSQVSIVWIWKINGEATMVLMLNISIHLYSQILQLFSATQKSGGLKQLKQ